MNVVLWAAQIILAAIFLTTGGSKLFAYERLIRVVEARSKSGAPGVMPGDLLPPHELVRMAAAGLALIMVLAGIYHLRRQEPAAPDVTLFLLAVFVIVGRWPR